MSTEYTSVAEADFEGDELSGAPALVEDFELEDAQPSKCVQCMRLSSNFQLTGSWASLLLILQKSKREEVTASRRH